MKKVLEVAKRRSSMPENQRVEIEATPRQL